MVESFLKKLQKKKPRKFYLFAGLFYIWREY